MSLWRPLDTQNRINPYPMYEQLRSAAPVYRANTGEWILTTYKDVKAILTDRSYGVGNRKEWLHKGVTYLADKQIDLQYILKAIDTFILQLDPPQHTHIRRFITEHWDKDGVNGMIKQHVKVALNAISQPEFDLVTDFTSKIPAANLCSIMGLSTQDQQLLHELSHEMIKALDLYVSVKDLVQLNEAAHEFINFFRTKIDARDFGDGLLKKLYEANKQEGYPLTDEQFISVMIFLFVAGEETSVSFLGLALYHIYSNNLQKEYAGTEHIATRMEELLRYDSPVQVLGRIAGKNTVVGNTKIRRGDTLTLVIGAANRDPEAFDMPHRLMPDRNPRHLSFGKGIHFCLGDWLARMTAQITIPMFINRFSTLKLVSEPDSWYDNIAIRGFQKLKVTTKSSLP